MKGLVILIAPPGVGKTIAIEQLGGHFGVTPFRYLEPIEARTATWSDLPVDHFSGDHWNDPDLLEYFEGGTILVDSLRIALFESGGTTLRGGFTAGALRKLTELNNLLYQLDRVMITPVNPIYSHTDPNYLVARSLISASVNGVLEGSVTDNRVSIQIGKQSVFDPFLEDDPSSSGKVFTWEMYRDRDGELSELETVLNSINLTR